HLTALLADHTVTALQVYQPGHYGRSSGSPGSPPIEVSQSFRQAWIWLPPSAATTDRGGVTMQTPMLDSQNESAQPQSDIASASPTRKARSPRGVTATLSYLGPTPVRPYNYTYEPPAGTPWQNCEYWPSEVRIEDARSIALPPSIHVEGFELRDARSSMRDFGDEEAIREHYYAEAAELARCVTGAGRAYVFVHLVRHREAGRPALSFGRRGDGSRPGAAGRVHNDYSEISGARRLGIESSNHGFQSQVKRFSIVNIW